VQNWPLTLNKEARVDEFDKWYECSEAGMSVTIKEACRLSYEGGKCASLAGGSKDAANVRTTGIMQGDKAAPKLPDDDVLDGEFNSILTHAFAGSNTDDIDRETWQLALDGCVKYVKKLSGNFV